MTENNQDRKEQTGSNQDSKQGTTQTGNTGQEGTDENPQEGSEWGNYRTRELSSNEEGTMESGENKNTGSAFGEKER